MALAVYSREEVSILIDGIIIEGFVEGDFCTIERAEDQTELVVGTHGEVDAAVRFIPNGTVTLTTMASSIANSVLQAFKTAWDNGGYAVFGLSIRDTNSEDTLATCRDAIISKDPSQSYGNTRGPREWTILCPHLQMRVSGATRIA